MTRLACNHLPTRDITTYQDGGITYVLRSWMFRVVRQGRVVGRYFKGRCLTRTMDVATKKMLATSYDIHEWPNRNDGVLSDAEENPEAYERTMGSLLAGWSSLSNVEIWGVPGKGHLISSSLPSLPLDPLERVAIVCISNRNSKNNNVRCTIIAMRFPRWEIDTFNNVYYRGTRKVCILNDTSLRMPTC